MAVPCVKLDKVNGIFSVCTFTVINLHYLDFHLAINVRKFGVLEFSAFKKFSQSLISILFNLQNHHEKLQCSTTNVNIATK